MTTGGTFDIQDGFFRNRGQFHTAREILTDQLHRAMQARDRAALLPARYRLEASLQPIGAWSSPGHGADVFSQALSLAASERAGDLIAAARTILQERIDHLINALEALQDAPKAEKPPGDPPKAPISPDHRKGGL